MSVYASTKIFVKTNLDAAVRLHPMQGKISSNHKVIQ